MVPSNKKQKIREDLVEYFFTLEETNPDSVSNMQSLKEREKRRKLDTFTREVIEEEGTKADEDKVKAEEIQFDTDMGDRYLTIQQYVKTTTPSIPETVEVGNLPWDTTERDICKLFSDCVINSVRLGKSKETGEFKGYAHVDFKDSVSVALALKLDQLAISGRPVNICCALKEISAGDNSTNLTPNEANNGNYVARRVGTGKRKRRTCYNCREKGHLAKACLKKNLADDAHDQANEKLDQEAVNASPAMLSYDLQKNDGGSYIIIETYTAANEAHSGSLASEVSFGKMKRKTCYECREKGHFATACPKKLQNSDHTNANVDHQTVLILT